MVATKKTRRIYFARIVVFFTVGEDYFERKFDNCSFIVERFPNGESMLTIENEHERVMGMFREWSGFVTEPKRDAVTNQELSS